MNSRTSRRFRDELARLPLDARHQAKRAYRLFASDPYHQSLHFRKVHAAVPVYSARVGLHYRAVGMLRGSDIVWFWIGSHADYDALLRELG